MASLSNILDQLANAIRGAIDGIDWEIQVEPWLVITPSPVTVDMYPASPRVDDGFTGFGGSEEAKLFTVRARTNTPDSDAARDVILSLMDVEDEHSVVSAIEDDQTLNGYASSVDVVDRTGLQAYPTADGILGYLGCEWTVLVLDVSS